LGGEGCLLKDNSIRMELRERREKCPPAPVGESDASKLRKKYRGAFAGAGPDG